MHTLINVPLQTIANFLLLGELVSFSSFSSESNRGESPPAYLNCKVNTQAHLQCKREVLIVKTALHKAQI